MKRFKLILASVAMVLGIGAALAFEPSDKSRETPLVPMWFEYTGPQFPTEAEAKNPQNYQPLLGNPCTSSVNLCAILATPSSQDPDIPVIQEGTTLSNAIEAYVSSGGTTVDNTLIKEEP